jgi:hypothetical protein
MIKLILGDSWRIWELMSVFFANIQHIWKRDDGGYGGKSPLPS